MSFVSGLQCRECKRKYPVRPGAACEECFGPLEVTYDIDGWKEAAREGRLLEPVHSMWRYARLLPLEGPPRVGLETGWTPLVRSRKLAATLGLKELWLKNDAVNAPTLSFKDRVVSVALSKALEFGFTVVGCSSTGNLANAVAAQAAAVGLKSYVLVPADLESEKLIASAAYGARLVRVLGNYDQVNRLCTEIADGLGWAFVNVNLRPFYAEGSKTVGYEIVEQLGWRVPRHIVVPMAGGSLITKIHKAIGELQALGLAEKAPFSVHGVQAEGCAPIVQAVRQGLDRIQPVKPRTIAKSLAIGNPADGHFARRTILESGGSAESATDPEIVEGIRLLAETEGILAETAGGVTVAAAKKLIERGAIPRDESVVLCITGNGLKTLDAIRGSVQFEQEIQPSFDAFLSLVENLTPA
ncbi:MAG: threonine synthase [Acidobacteria bacterium]|nr:threonine synthase [Acidobacteriota bacterium]